VGTGRREWNHIFPKNGSKKFSCSGLDTESTVESAYEIRFFADAFLVAPTPIANGATPLGTQPIHLSGKSLVCKWSLRGVVTSSIIRAPAFAKHLCQRNV
jgi:hypothetical protein